jgi:hypothetical protein
MVPLLNEIVVVGLRWLFAADLRWLFAADLRWLYRRILRRVVGWRLSGLQPVVAEMVLLTHMSTRLARKTVCNSFSF